MGRFCGEHGRYALPPEICDKLDDAPLLGCMLDGRYVLVDLIGDGGMGVIYRGLQLPLERSVAIKVMHGTFTAKADIRERFRVEAQTIATLRSENTVTLYEFSVARIGPIPNLTFMVMELVEGESLGDRLSSGPLEIDEIAAIFRGLERSLTEAHAAGIIHRDLKPDNVLLARTPDGHLMPKVIDFGIAYVSGVTRTRSGVLVGTPFYMAPEQCNAKRAKPLDHRVDIYALGVLLYEMVAHKVPFQDEEPLAVLLQHQNDTPPPLPGTGQFPRASALNPVVQKALAKDPDDRFQSVAEFAAALAEAIADVPAAEETLRSQDRPISVPIIISRAPRSVRSVKPTKPARPVAPTVAFDEPPPEEPRGPRTALLLLLLCVTAALAFVIAWPTEPPLPPKPVIVRAVLDAGVDAAVDAAIVVARPAGQDASTVVVDALAPVIAAKPADASAPDAAVPTPAKRRSRADEVKALVREVRRASRKGRCPQARRAHARLRKLDTRRAADTIENLRKCRPAGVKSAKPPKPDFDPLDF